MQSLLRECHMVKPSTTHSSWYVPSWLTHPFPPPLTHSPTHPLSVTLIRAVERCIIREAPDNSIGMRW